MENLTVWTLHDSLVQRNREILPKTITKFYSDGSAKGGGYDWYD
jgi:hypothetical protein